MLTMENVDQWRGADLVDRDGDKIGSIDDIYLDDETGQPEFVLVKTGFFGTGAHFVPLQGATQDGDRLVVQFSKDQVKDAPGLDADDHLTQEQESRLYSYYGISYSDARSDSGLPEGTAGTGMRTGTGTGEVWDRDAVGRDTSGPTTDDAMTRAEEELAVGTTSREAGRARLRKYIVTEQQNVTVPVTREEVRIEREPITDANADAAMSGPELSEEEHEVVLHEEQAVVEKRVVPKERVRLEKETVTDEEQVSEEIRKERIEVEGDAATRRPDERL
jgi:uncharacterized protein (TIGR02271 family)